MKSKLVYSFGNGKTGVRVQDNTLELVKLTHKHKVGNNFNAEAQTSDLIKLKFESKKSLMVLIDALNKIKTGLV